MAALQSRRASASSHTGSFTFRPGGYLLHYYLCCAPPPVLANDTVFNAINEFCRDCESWRTVHGVVMPDHLHGLIRPMKERDAKPTTFSADLKRRVREQTNARWQWQEGVFDRLLRKSEFAEAKWHYMRENPVRAGFVPSWQNWPYLIEGEL